MGHLHFERSGLRPGPLIYVLMTSGAALDGLGAAGGSELVEGAGTVCLDGVFGNEKLRGDLARWQKAADKPDDPVRAAILSGTSDDRIVEPRAPSDSVRNFL